jgi:hypothetical protein
LQEGAALRARPLRDQVRELIEFDADEGRAEEASHRKLSQHGLSGEMRRRIICLSMFWHFLDIIWIGVFTFVPTRVKKADRKALRCGPAPSAIRCENS